jgi:hypothetical protein
MSDRRAEAAPDDRMRRFEQEVEELASLFMAQPYANYTQSQLASDLKRVQGAARKALEVLRSLHIVDSPDAPNFPLFFTLLFGLNRHRAKNGQPPLYGTDFPSSVVSALIQLQEAAETALVTNGPRPGNASRRTPEQALVERAAMAFVLRYHTIFERWPPKSTSGPCVDAMERFLERLGASPDVDAAGVLRRAIDAQREAEKERESFSNDVF